MPVCGPGCAYFTTGEYPLTARARSTWEDTVTVGAWTRPAEHLRATVHASIAGVWTLTHTAELGALRLALLPGADDDLALTTAAADLGIAADALERAVADLPRTALVVDFGEAPLDEVQACRTALAGLIVSALATLGQAVTHPAPGAPEATTPADQAAGAGPVDPAVLAAAGTAMARLTCAYWRITGIVP